MFRHPKFSHEEVFLCQCCSLVWASKGCLIDPVCLSDFSSTGLKWVCGSCAGNTLNCLDEYLGKEILIWRTESKRIEDKRLARRQNWKKLLWSNMMFLEKLSMNKRRYRRKQENLRRQYHECNREIDRGHSSNKRWV